MRRENRQIISESTDNNSLIFKLELDFYEVIDKVKRWLPHRKWLENNRVDFSDYPEEIEYKRLLTDFKLKEKAEHGRMSNNMMKAAWEMTLKEIEKIRSVNAFIKNRQNYLA